MLDNLTLAYLILELKFFLEEAYINKVSEIKQGVLKIKIHSKNGSKDLILTPNSPYLSNYSIQARHGKSNFAISLKKELYNKKIRTIEQYEFDRVCVIKLIEHLLVLELMGEGNMILLNEEGTIISCLKNESWTDRTTKKGEKYQFPKARAQNPLKYDKKSIIDAFKESKKDSIRTLISNLSISPLAAEEVFYKTKIDKKKPAVELKETELSKILEETKKLYTINEKNLKPVKYKEFVYPFKLNHLEETPEKIDSISAYIDEQLSKDASVSKHLLKEENQSKEKLSGLEFQKKQQEEARKKFEKGIEENKKKAEVIYEHYSELEELKNAVLIAMKKGLKEKEIMYTFSSAASKGNKTAGLIKKIDLSRKKIEVEL